MDDKKKYVIISGLNLHDNNRGTAALGYGAISFLQQKGILDDKITLVNLRRYNNFLKPLNRRLKEETFRVNSVEWNRISFGIFVLEWWLLKRFGLLLPWSKSAKVLKQVKYVAAINGGDGFSDIYGTDTFHSRLLETWIGIRLKIPVIQLPQTLGPFRNKDNYDEARYILKHSEQVYVRDDKFVSELDKMGVKFDKSKDLSAYMLPESWNIDVKSNSVGINVSGLAYSNKFRQLSGQFEMYPELMKRLICHFRNNGHTVYLIPHSYNYQTPEENNDDIVACRDAYNSLEDKTNVVMIDKDLISPQVKYVISKMTFFIGTRMHANFAAIYTGVPVFGLAYSYKFEGAFNANGLDGAMQTAMINSIKKSDIDDIIAKIDSVYLKYKSVN